MTTPDTPIKLTKPQIKAMQVAAGNDFGFCFCARITAERLASYGFVHVKEGYVGHRIYLKLAGRIALEKALNP